MKRKSTLLVISIAVLLSPFLRSQETGEEEDKPLFTKRIVVSARRLADEGLEVGKVPANVTVITREEIENSGARTLQELLSVYAGMIFFDDVGNGVESTIDLRGFSEGTAAAVYVDGARVNEPDDNRVNLEFLDLDAVERIEIIPGGTSASDGNGAVSGTIKIYTRRGYRAPLDEAEVSYGSFGTTRAGLRSSRRSGPHSYFLSYGFTDSDGFRENGSVRQHKFLGKYNYDIPESSDLELSYRYYTGDLGNPGALTQDELASDRRQSPFNRTDFNKSDEGVLNLNYTQYFTDSTYLTASGYRRDVRTEILTTGRYAAVFGGFRSETDGESLGLAVQGTYDRSLRSWGHNLSAGFEVTRDNFDNEGFITDTAGVPADKANERSTEQRNRAFFVQGAFTVGNFMTLSGGLRHDRVSMDFSDQLSAATGIREFSKATGSAGLTFEVDPALSFYLRYAQAFQTPTVNDLFAFPLFGSNPDLVPVTGETYEGGARAALHEAVLLQAAFYRMDLENEIVFVYTDPAYFIGRNENVGRSRRTGLEVQVGGRPARDLDIFASYSYTKTENISLGEQLGTASLRIPLVPDHKFAFSTNYKLGSIGLGADGLYVGGQVLSGDQANEAPLLDPYFLLNLRAALESGYWTVRLELRNALDEEYETRGIYSFGSSYLTPGPGRAIIGVLELKY